MRIVLIVQAVSLAVGITALSAAGDVWTDADRTAVVVTVGKEALRELEASPDLEHLQSWFLSGGEPAQVVAVDKGPAEVVIVRDPASQAYLDILAKGFLDRELAQTVAPLMRTGGPETTWDPRILQRGEEAFIEVGRELYKTRRRRVSDADLVAAREALRTYLNFDEDTYLSFLSPLAAPVSRTVEQMHVFNLSHAIPADKGGLLSFVELAPSLPFVRRFSDAIALVGRQLHSTNHRRAIVVLIEGKSRDRSQHSSAGVRNLLKTLQVPVFVWSFGPGPVVDEWGGYLLSERPEHLEVDADLTVLTDAHADLRATLETQRVVWLEGHHLAAEIELTTSASGIRLAGTAP